MAYCAAGGVLALALAAPLGRLFHVPLAVLVVVGAGALVWAFVLPRVSLSLVAAANAAAALAIAVLAVLAPGTAGRLLLVAVCVEVAAFAAAQARLLAQR
jgi:hypothetical protein